MANRSSAGVTGRSCFCQGWLATTTSIRSRWSATVTASATWTCPRWMGSNVPPKMPRRVAGLVTSGAGQGRHHRSERVHLGLVHDHVREAETLTTLDEPLGDLLDRPDEGDRRAVDLLRRDTHHRRESLDGVLAVRDDLDQEGQHLQFEVGEPGTGGLADPGDPLVVVPVS